MRTRILFTILLITTTVHAAPQIAFDTATVKVKGLTARGRAAWFEIAVVPHGYTDRIISGGGILVADDSGTLDVGQAPLPGAVFLAVDLENGAPASAAQKNPIFRPRMLPAAALRHRAGGITAGLHLTDPSDIVVLVRPGAGAWSTACEGSVDLAALSDVNGSAPPPTDFMPGDIIFVVEPLSRVVQTITVR